uniref:Uncharacterized protein n=1 Tax=viral metagenome TaxID=1070528 RepID=A0A6C0ERI2_9ZZZZ
MTSISNNNEISMPPSPPFIGDTQFLGGEFRYIKNSHERTMLVTAYKAIQMTESWDFIKKDIESFTFSEDKIVDLISNKIVELGYCGHSGCSFGYTMRRMQYIARNGENEFMKKYISQ